MKLQTPSLRVKRDSPWEGHEAIWDVCQFDTAQSRRVWSLTQAVGELAAKAKVKTSHTLKCLWRLKHALRNVFFKICDAQILPILMYVSELRGFKKKKKKWYNKKKRLICLHANDFQMLASSYQTKWSMVTQVGILCLLHLLYDVLDIGCELQIYLTIAPQKRHITCCCICTIFFFFFSCPAYEEFRRDSPWMEELHRAAAIIV